MYFKNKAENETYSSQPSNLSCVLLGYCDNIEPKYCTSRLVSLYNKYCSDHAMVLTIPENPDSSVYVSFNVEHNAHVLHRIMRFVNSVNSSCGGDPKTMVLPQERIDAFVEKILELKNRRIHDLISGVVSKYFDRLVIINLQEVSPSLFVHLGRDLKGIRCKMTKLVPQHVVEVLLDYDRDQLENLGLVGSEPKDIAGIEMYIDDLIEQIPSEYNPAKHQGRFSVNGSFLSLIHQPNENCPNIWFEPFDTKLHKTEEDYASLAVIANMYVGNQVKFVKSRPVMLHTQICGTTSGLLHNGVMLGSFFVNCRGILIEHYGVINYHGHLKYGSSERLLNAIRNNNPNDISDLLDVFEQDFFEERTFTITETPTIYIGLEMYRTLLESFMSTLSPLTSTIDCIGGDFNMKNEVFRTYGVTNKSVDLMGGRNNANDRIISCLFECDKYTPRLHRKTILNKSDNLDVQSHEDQITEAKDSE